MRNTSPNCGRWVRFAVGTPYRSLAPAQPQRRIGNPENFADNSCQVVRYAEKEDMRTDEGLRLALSEIKTFKGKCIALWGSMPCAGGSPWQCVNEAHYFRTGNHSDA
eukprot:798846-Pyramimonas_sp.AAC.1